MRLSEIRPCDSCNGKIGTGSYKVRVSPILVVPQSANQVLGLTQVLAGNLRLAETFAPDDQPVKVLGEEDSSLWTDLIVCQRCALEKPLELAMLLEKRSEAEETARG